MHFTYQPNPIKIIFGSGRMQELTKEIRAMGMQKPGILAHKRYDRLVEHLQDDFGAEHVFVFQHTQEKNTTETEQEVLAIMQAAEVLIAIGEEPIIQLAKVVGSQKSIPIIALPSTFSGLEMTNVYHRHHNNRISIGSHAKAYPTTVVYDPHLLVDMPVPQLANSAMQAMAHLIDALYAKNANPITYQSALQGIQALRIGMETYIKEQSMQNAGATLFFGAYLAGRVWAEVEMALQHKLVHLLHTQFSIAENEAHAVLLPYVLAFNSAGIKRVMEDIKSILQSETPSLKLRELAEGMGAPITLAQIGMKEEHVSQAASLLADLEFYNPINVTEESALALLESAFIGDL